MLCVYGWVWSHLIVSIKVYGGGINCEKVTIGADSFVEIKLMFYARIICICSHESQDCAGTVSSLQTCSNIW